MKRFTETILEKLNTLVVVVNNNGKVEYVSPAAQQILGYNPDELLGDGWWQLTRETAAERSDIQSFVNDILAKKTVEESYTYERILSTSTGDKKWILWNTTPGPEGTVIGIGQDITDRKVAEIQLAEKNRLLEQKNTEISDSINYAKRIQEAILPDEASIRRTFPDFCVFYAPKDVVSGDFYWYYRKNDLVFLAALDCTGHGVPGAMMSVLGNSLLREIIIKRELTEPAEILRQLDDELYLALNGNSNGEDYKEGMDLALLVFNRADLSVKFSGAMRPLVIVSKDGLKEIRGSRYPIGAYIVSEKQFEQHEINLNEGDHLYLYSDGFPDQFGGEKGKKFNKKRFFELLETASDMIAEEKEAYFEYALRNWKQDEEQTDDILILGVRV